MAAKKATNANIDRRVVSARMAKDKSTLAEAQKWADKGYVVSLSRNQQGDLTYTGSPRKTATPKTVTTSKGTMTGKAKKK